MHAYAIIGHLFTEKPNIYPILSLQFYACKLF